jgi:hypothetical protein
MEKAFVDTKANLVNAATLAHPSQAVELGLIVDSSSSHVGVALEQRWRGQAAWEPLGFFSRKLNAAQSKYRAFDRELWAAFSGIRFFNCMLEGGVLRSAPMISCSPVRCTGCWSPGLLASSGTSPILLNTQAPLLGPARRRMGLAA